MPSPLPAGEPPREEAVLEALASELRASDATSGTRDPPSVRVPQGPGEDCGFAFSGRPFLSASSISAPTLVAGGAADRIVPAEHREALLRDLVRAPAKRELVIPGATHMAAFEARRGELFQAIEALVSEPLAPAR